MRRQGELLEALVRDRWAKGGVSGLSRELGVSRATLYSWFRGDTAPDTVRAARLAELLGMAPADLMEAISPAPMRELYATPESRPRMASMNLWVPTIGEAVLARDVVSCDADDPIGPVARHLYQADYSQMPVRDRGEWRGLLTSEAIARWMAGRSPELGVDDRAPVREVLAYEAVTDNFQIVGPGEPVATVIREFEARASGGSPLDAVLVTHDGSAGADLVGIVTAWDIPHLRSSA